MKDPPLKQWLKWLNHHYFYGHFQWQTVKLPECKGKWRVFWINVIRFSSAFGLLSFSILEADYQLTRSFSRLGTTHHPTIGSFPMIPFQSFPNIHRF